ncbi:uncharacterized protein Dwil_GK25186 [Drosophila willistoni]|uniref:Uncharacterized protein n=1 Tax=Drosophila willistoni TaxID=7260 RepID=B4NBV4_DROWI|nr:uncharacterized protein Dwil_GK25186 [Drosophila willistoni]
MPGRANRINILTPMVSSFSELSMLRGSSIKFPTELAKSNIDAVEVSTVAALQEHDESSPHFLYVINAKGQILEHIQYYGDDYRAALRKAFVEKA